MKGQITKITIKNCPKVKELNLNNNEISEIILEGEFLNLERLESHDNKLKEIDISKAPNLTFLSVARNPINNIKGLGYSTQLKFVNLTGTPGFNGREYGEWKDAIKSVLDIPLTDPLPDTWKTDLENKLDELKNRPTTDYSGPLKEILGLNPADNLPVNWQDQLAKKDDLAAAQSDLKEWTDKFPDKSPAEVENENKKAVNDLQKELDGWKNEFAGKNPQDIAQELADANQDKDKLNDWQGRFPDKTPQEVANELNDLRDKPTGSTLTAEQEKKLNDYEIMAAYLDENLGGEWEAVVQIEKK